MIGLFSNHGHIVQQQSINEMMEIMLYCIEF